MDIIFRLIAIIIGYAFGLIQTGFFIGKIYKIDIRDHGSGSSGATNMTRTLGKWPGVVTLIVDVLKPMAAYLLTAVIFSGVQEPELYKILCLYAAVSTVLGHIYPFYLGFRGGKGVATTGGMAIIFAAGVPSCATSWPAVAVALSVFILIVAVTKYVSLGSVSAAATLFLMYLILGQNGKLIFETGSVVLYEWYALLFVTVIVVITKHSSNIKRLLNGTENKLNLSKNN